MTSFFRRPAPPPVKRIVIAIALIIFAPLLVAAVTLSMSLYTRASGTKANITVSANVTLESISTDFYHAFAQGGEEANDMIAPVVSETKALSPKIIRIDHIYDHFDVVSGSSGNLSFNFDKLDQIVGTIISTGAKPLLALSFMPAVIAKDGSIINPPNNWDDWAAVVKRTVEHYSGKGEKNISGVYYEVWNEPDLDQFGKWKLSGEKNYLTLYRYAAQGATSATNVNGFYIGGPSTTGLYKNWIIGLANSGARIDFFSWHTYLSDPKRYMTDQHNLVDWLLPYPGLSLKPTLITEFGFTGAKNKLYGTMFGAAHTAAVIRQLISGGPTYLFSFELMDGPNQEDGSGWGLFTHTTNGKKPKPRYSIYSFMDVMRGKRLQLTGEGSWVTAFATKRDTVIRIFLVNFDANGSHSETVPIRIIGLANGAYTYKEQFLFGRSVQTDESVVNGTITKEVFMQSQSMAILEITQK
jgi:hypothetical protein